MFRSRRHDAVSELQDLLEEAERRIATLSRSLQRRAPEYLETAQDAAASARSAALHARDAALAALPRDLPKQGRRLFDQVIDGAHDVLDQMFPSRQRRRAQRDMMQYGSDALSYGRNTARYLAREAAQRPLVIVAVVIGVGLLAGIAGRR